MAQSALQSLSALNGSGLDTVTLTAAAGSSSSGFLINPWLGLIGIGVLVISGAVAVIREILIEEEEQV